MFQNAIRVIAILVSTAALAQSVQPSATPRTLMPNQQGPTGREGLGGNKTADPLAALRQQVADMETTLSKMHVDLKQMHAKVTKNSATDSQTKANLEMWELMVGQLDKELQQTRDTLAFREDMEARRVALYKQADAKGAAEAEKFRAAQAARLAHDQQYANGTPTPTATIQSAAGQTAPAQPSAAAPTDHPASPK